MSTVPEIDRDEPDYRNDGSKELDARASVRLLFNEPAIRNYAFAAFGSLAMIVLMLLEQGSDVGAILIAITAVCGIFLRFTAAPVLVLIILTYFMWTPTGIPGQADSMPWLIELRRFHFIDVMLVLSVLVYVISQYRIYGLIHQAVAFEGGARRPDEPATRRPASLIRPSELSTMLGLSVGLVIAGQLIWLFATSVQVAPAEDFPLRMAESKSSVVRYRFNEATGRSVYVALDSNALDDERFRERGVLSRGVSRFFVLVGMMFFGTLIARLVFRYWRLRIMGPAEAAMTLLDAGWEETHRERVRLEKWRLWGRKKAEAQAQHKEKSGSKP
jgi:hypothetical protein